MKNQRRHQTNITRPSRSRREREELPSSARRTRRGERDDWKNRAEVGEWEGEVAAAAPCRGLGEGRDRYTVARHPESVKHNARQRRKTHNKAGKKWKPDREGERGDRKRDFGTKLCLFPSLVYGYTEEETHRGGGMEEEEGHTGSG